ncbi:major facilitator superfamily domain-containing protein [Thermothelomyces heterothallicus CBS 202.75]|uniref:major facilitator superfamily domain-containing protein n=1 Tax=Thermothelomyces heterothallicus CBS 202.75 TaxID=1149848 RepID=UPI0037428F4C
MAAPEEQEQHGTVAEKPGRAPDDTPAPPSGPKNLGEDQQSLQAVDGARTDAPPERGSPDLGSAGVGSTNRRHDSNAGRVSVTGRDPTPYSIFSGKEKGLIVLIVSAAGFFSSVSTNIYFPALNSIAQEYRVSSTLVNLTITVYLIFQGLAPSFTGSLSDSVGRRPVYAVCFAIYIAANVGLALQRRFAALVVLRCLQSSGSSGTVALGNAVVSDVAGPHERGSYIGYVSLGAVVGLSLGSTLGGVLAQFLGWRSIFWFLTISAAAVVVLIALFMPETARVVVGDGSLAPPRWDRSLWDLLPSTKKRRRDTEPAAAPGEEGGTQSPRGPAAGHRRRRQFVNPFMTLRICADKEAGMVLLVSGIVYAGYTALVGAIPSQFEARYGFNDLELGLCYLPIGVSAALSSLVVGRALDWNFARHARLLGLSVEQVRQQQQQQQAAGGGGGGGTNSGFAVERVRCEVAFPTLALFCAGTAAYGWLLSCRTSVAGPMVTLFVLGFGVNGCYTILSVLLIDVYPRAPATATAANNLVRCWLGAGAAAAIVPMIDSMGPGWAFTLIALLDLLTVPLLWVVMRWGPKWRAERIVAEKASEANSQEEK